MPRITQPREDEPIRLVTTATGHRYRAVLTTSPKGAPRKQVTTTWDTLGEARTWVAETRERVKNGHYTARSKITLRELTEDWLASRRDIRTVSREGYRSVLGRVLDHLGDRQVQSLTRRDVETVMESMQTKGGRKGKPLSQRTQVYALGALRQVLAYGVSNGVLSSNPAADVKARRRTLTDRQTVAVWSPENLRTFREAVDRQADPWAKAGLRLTLCGLRRSEVLGLAWSSVDLDAGTVRVEASRVKTGAGYTTERDEPKSAASSRTVLVETMQPGTVAALRALKASQAAQRLAAGPAFVDSGLVVADALGVGIHPEVFSLRFRGLVKASGVPPIRLHAVRHSIALMLHRAGVAPADAASLLGHEVATHLTFYVPSTESGSASAAARLGEVLAVSQ